MHFSFDTSPARVLFGRGTVQTALPPEVERMGLHRVLVVAGRSHEPLARQVTRPFAEAAVAWFTDVVPHVPATSAERAVALAHSFHADGVLSIGGGATTGTAKIVAREARLPIVSVPTTYAGSEMTPVWGMTTAGRAESGTDPGVQPRTVILDPDLTDGLPRDLAVTSGLSALAHAVEAYWAPGANPMSSALADEALAALAEGLRAIGPVSLAQAATPESALVDPVTAWAGTRTTAGEQLLYGAFLAGSILATTGAGLHHRLCQVLGAAFKLPGAALHAVVLPHVVAFNAPAVPAAARRIARALGDDEPVLGLRRLYAEIGAPTSLEELGLRRKQLPEAVDRVVETLPVDNPRPVGSDEVGVLVTAAFEGSLG